MASGQGCFLFYHCDTSRTHLETETGFNAELEWVEGTPPFGPVTAAWAPNSPMWLLGPSGAANSEDGGETWATIPGFPEGLVGMDAPEEGNPWFVGLGGAIGTWEEGTYRAVASNTSQSLRDISFRSGDEGVAVGDGGAIVRTLDSGSTWMSEQVGEAHLRAVEETYVGVIWVVGDAGTLLRGDETGWQTVNLGTDLDLHAVAFASSNRGIIGGEAGAVWTTADGGLTWVPGAAPGEVTAVAYVGSPTDSKIVAAGGSGTLWSFDGTDWGIEAETSDGSGLLTIAESGVLTAGTSSLAWTTVLTGFSEQVEVTDCPRYVGRPLAIQGETRLPRSEGRPSRWLRQAQEEHASVAAFARFTLQLLSVGAPSDLIGDAIRAQADELRHARLSLDRAGGTLGPMDISGPMATDLITIARETATGGCIGETAAVWDAIVAAESDPAFWRPIAADETRHAALAWRFLRWAVEQDPSVLPAILPLFGTRPAHVPVEVWERVIQPAIRAVQRPAGAGSGNWTSDDGPS